MMVSPAFGWGTLLFDSTAVDPETLAPALASATFVAPPQADNNNIAAPINPIAFNLFILFFIFCFLLPQR
jgi:hypothetical protein